MIPEFIRTLDLKPGGKSLLAMADGAQKVKAGGPMKWIGTAITKTHGDVLILYTEEFEAMSPAQQAEMMEHEAHHIACATFSRCGDRDMMLFNMAADCAINHHLNRDNLTEEMCFFDKFGATPMPAEAMYEYLKEQQEKQGNRQGCGHVTIDLRDVPVEKLPDLLKLAGEVAKSIGAGQHVGGGGDIVLPPVATYPEWLKELERLLKSKTTITRRRTWMRESRVIDSVRGKHRVRRRDTLGGLVLLDASGSMWGELPMLLALIMKYLPKADGAVWDTVASPRGPVSGMLKKTQEVGGGGTSPGCAVGLRKPDEITVWISDGYVDGWPEMTADDIVVLTQEGGQVPRGGKVIRAY